MPPPIQPVPQKEKWFIVYRRYWKRKGPPGEPGRGRTRARALIRRLRERRARRNGATSRVRRRNRKAALALSVGMIGSNTSAAVHPPDLVTTTQNEHLHMVERRRNATQLKASETLKKALIAEEGVRHVVYRDVAGYATVGVGHLIGPKDGLAVGDRIDDSRILDFFEQDIENAEHGVRLLVGNLPLFQHEFDALVDLVYNVGQGNLSQKRSPRLNRAIAQGDYDAIAAELDYRHAGGAVAQGLVYRSERRANMFTFAEYDDPRAQG